MTKKVKIWFLILVWGIVMIQLYVNGKGKEESSSEIITTFSMKEENVLEKTNEFLMEKAFGRKENPEERIYACGYLGQINLSSDLKKEMLKNLAQKLGITKGYLMEEMDDKEYSKITLKKKEDSLETIIEIVSRKQKKDPSKQYIMMKINGRKKINEAIVAYQRIKNIYDEIGVKGKVFLEIIVEKSGEYKEKEKEEWIEKFFNSLRIKKIDEIKKEDIYTVYGYTKEVKEILKINEKNINIQVCFFYDERYDKTYIKIGTPIINSSY